MIKSAFPAILNVDELVYYFPHIYFTKTIYKLVEKCRIQPVYVIDVASAIMASLKDDGASMGKTYELGGPQVMTMHELVLSLSLITIPCDFAITPLVEIKKKLVCHIKSNTRSLAMGMFVPKQKCLSKLRGTTLLAFTFSTSSDVRCNRSFIYFITVI